MKAPTGASLYPLKPYGYASCFKFIFLLFFYQSVLKANITVPVGGIIPGDIKPGTLWGIICGFSGDVTLCVLLGGLPGLELKAEKHV